MDTPRGFTPSMVRLWEKFLDMPGVGSRSAERLTYYVMELSREEAMGLAEAVRDIKDKVGACSVCYNISESDPCEICSDNRRDSSLLCVVEDPRDLLALENTAGFRGLYHVLHGHISPLDGVEPENLTIDSLEKRVGEGKVKEIILATNPTVEGDATALYIARRLRDTGVKVTRLARGLPTGGSIEHSTPGILGDAISGRTQLS